MDFLTKAVLSIVVVVIGAPSLPLTSGTSAPVILGILTGIWGIDWTGGE